MAQLTLLLRKAKRSNDIKLDLSNKEISFIPNDVYQLPKLQILNLSHNRITSLDQKIIQLTNLKVLDLTQNSLMDLPEQILKLQNLQALILDGNPLIKKFEPLLNQKASLDIKKSLRQCFGLQKAEQLSQTPSWLNQKQMMNNSKAFGKMVQIQGKYKTQQKRVEQLQKQLDKLALKQKKSSKQSFQLEQEAILQINFNQLKIGDQISMGGFSTIHKGVYKSLKVAIKKVFNPKINEQLLQQFSNQINMLAKFRHPNIVLLIGICSIPPNLAIVSQYIQNGSLYDLLHKQRTKLSQNQIKKIVKQILSSIAYLHGHNIVHRDIKSHNFLVDENYTVKLCDFGLARRKDLLNQGPMQFSGTPVYMSQQLFMKKSYDQTVDIFALGTLLYQVYAGQIPYTGLDPADIKQKIMKDSNLPNSKLNVPKQIMEVINQCRCENSKKRPSAMSLIQMNIW